MTGMWDDLRLEGCNGDGPSLGASPLSEESWLSGRKRRTRNAKCRQRYRGFESLTLLHPFPKGLKSQKMLNKRGRRG
ncbi:protein of unknown function [uncultured Sphingopyxis sp.]|uniref:Uncharacterized protein n=1 Tax=uncultured Sphingopyxis sp. TaxID=310581 RepID=A0A1Y5PS92_9SPHN|nr:protein of unknown function [uncultured Sphingopyxis sp.]